MDTGEWLTKLSVWLSLAGYAIGAGMRLIARERRENGARWAWTLGCAFMIAHVALAFGSYHNWSHAAAQAETARETWETTGIHWGGGIHFNYVFVAAWTVDAAWWWISPSTWAGRPRWLTSLWHGFAFFMVLNGAVVFADGPARWLGGLICGTLVVVWWRKCHGEPAFHSR
jgi:hypothetical protein